MARPRVHALFWCTGLSFALGMSLSTREPLDHGTPKRDQGVKSMPLPAEALEELSDVGFKFSMRATPTLKDIHRQPRLPIQWFHFSKAGGSLMCALARSVEYVVRPDLNCNWADVDFHADRQVSCKERNQFYSLSGFTYGQIERPFEERDYCPDAFLYGTMLRDPLKLAQSRMNFGKVNNYKDVLTCVESMTNCDGIARRINYIYFDNFMIRFILGKAVFDLPLGQINQTHTEAAIKVLSKFDLVVQLEALEQESTREQLARFFGWRLEAGSKINASPHDIAFTADEERRIRSLLQHDYQLYTHFAGKSNFS